MSRHFYTDYVRHALRFYTRHLNIDGNFQSDVDKDNWKSCHSVLKNYTGSNLIILTDVYSGHDTLADEVYNASVKYKVEQNYIWDMMKEVEKKVAKKRGLL